MTRRGIALAVALLTVAAWLLWAERFDAGWRVVLATAGLWWLAALQATWRVWVPAVVVLAGLWVAIPPRRPRRRWSRLPHVAVTNVTASGVSPSWDAGSPVTNVTAATPEREPTQEPRRESPQTITPGSTPAPVRTVWEAFTVLHQERDDGVAS